MARSIEKPDYFTPKELLKAGLKFPKTPAQEYTTTVPVTTRSDLGRKATRNLQFCVVAMFFAHFYNIKMDETTFWIFKVKEAGPIEPLLFGISVAFILNWLQPLLADLRAFRVHWLEAIERLEDRIKRQTGKLAASAQNEALSPQSVSIEEVLKNASDPPLADATSDGRDNRCKIYVEDARNVLILQSLHRRFTWSYRYSLVTEHVLPLSSPLICLVIWLWP